MSVFASLPRSSRWPWLLGLASLLTAVGCAAYLLFGIAYSGQTASGASGTDGGVVTVTTTHGWQDYTIVGWASFVVLLGVLTALAAWRGRSGPVWVAAVLLVITAALGLASVGLFIAPVALLVAFTAYALSISRRRGRAAS
jgi:glucan phosphoethanolaminetransferase (alkaline phosphatase superfamily)